MPFALFGYLHGVSIAVVASRLLTAYVLSKGLVYKHTAIVDLHLVDGKLRLCFLCLFTEGGAQMPTRRTFILGIGYFYKTNVVYKLSLPGIDVLTTVRV